MSPNADEPVDQPGATIDSSVVVDDPVCVTISPPLKGPKLTNTCEDKKNDDDTLDDTLKKTETDGRQKVSEQEEKDSQKSHNHNINGEEKVAACNDATKKDDTIEPSPTSAKKVPLTFCCPYRGCETKVWFAPKHAHLLTLDTDGNILDTCNWPLLPEFYPQMTTMCRHWLMAHPKWKPYDWPAAFVYYKERSKTTPVEPTF